MELRIFFHLAKWTWDVPILPYESVSCSYLTPSSISFGEGNGTPLQYSCLENPMGGGAWWAAIHGVAKSRTRLSDFTFNFHFSLSCIGEGNGNPPQCSCLENPRDGGAWWAAVYGVAQSWTRLKQLSSSMLCKKEPEQCILPPSGVKSAVNIMIRKV